MAKKKKRKRHVFSEAELQRCRENGSRGGKTTAARHGDKLRGEWASKGGQIVYAKKGSDFMRKIGSKGGKWIRDASRLMRKVQSGEVKVVLIEDGIEMEVD